MKIRVTNEKGEPVFARVAVFAEIINELTQENQKIGLPGNVELAGRKAIVRVRELGWYPYEEVIKIVPSCTLDVVLQEDKVVIEYEPRKVRGWIEEKVDNVKKLWNSYGIGCPDED